MRNSRRSDGVSEVGPPADRPEPLGDQEPLEDEIERVLDALYGDDDDIDEGSWLRRGALGSHDRARGAGATP
jgi:hypothetical protein